METITEEWAKQESVRQEIQIDQWRKKTHHLTKASCLISREQGEYKVWFIVKVHGNNSFLMRLSNL